MRYRIRTRTAACAAVKDIPADVPLLIKPYDVDEIADMIARLIRERDAHLAPGR